MLRDTPDGFRYLKREAGSASRKPAAAKPEAGSRHAPLAPSNRTSARSPLGVIVDPNITHAAAVRRPELRRLQSVRHRHAVQRVLRRQLRPARLLRAVDRAARAGSSPAARSASPRRTTIARSSRDREHLHPRHSSSGRRRRGLGAASARPRERAAARVRLGLQPSSREATITDPAFVVPQNQNAHALRVGLDLQRAGWQASVWGSYTRAHRLAAMGDPGRRTDDAAPRPSSSATARACCARRRCHRG